MDKFILLMVSPDLESAGEVVSFYPNPFTTSINVVINDPSQNKAELKVFNILGEEVLNTTLIQQVNTIEASNLSSGIYTYKVISNNKTLQTGRLISQQ
ncbi:MAG: T9SS type A sorting domain-containing protein [Bacteroidia bacterium]|nr:T9SS type A sorting domain-containing protein [Bacteroidia bacterium]